MGIYEILQDKLNIFGVVLQIISAIIYWIGDGYYIDACYDIPQYLDTQNGFWTFCEFVPFIAILNSIVILYASSLKNRRVITCLALNVLIVIILQFSTLFYIYSSYNNLQSNICQISQKGILESCKDVGTGFKVICTGSILTFLSQIIHFYAIIRRRNDPKFYFQPFSESLNEEELERKQLTTPKYHDLHQGYIYQ